MGGKIITAPCYNTMGYTAAAAGSGKRSQRAFQGVKAYKCEELWSSQLPTWIGCVEDSSNKNRANIKIESTFVLMKTLTIRYKDDDLAMSYKIRFLVKHRRKNDRSGWNRGEPSTKSLHWWNSTKHKMCFLKLRSYPTGWRMWTVSTKSSKTLLQVLPYDDKEVVNIMYATISKWQIWCMLR